MALLRAIIDNWQKLLKWLQNYLKIKSEDIDFEVYKFIGDGWISLFDFDDACIDILEFLSDLSDKFDTRFNRWICDILDTSPEVLGLTFGLDRRPLVRMIMNGNVEYISRPVNVACRLQSSIKDKDKKPQYKAMITRHLYRTMHGEKIDFKTQEVTRIL